MYTEFILIYIGLGVLLLVSIAILVMLIVLLKRGGAANTRNITGRNMGQMGNYAQKQNGYQGIVFCRNCSAQYDATTRVCPRCGTPR